MTAQGLDFSVSAELRDDIRQWRTRAAIAGVAGAILCGIGLVSSPIQFYRSYLWSYMFVVGVSAGSLAWRADAAMSRAACRS